MELKGLFASISALEKHLYDCKRDGVERSSTICYIEARMLCNCGPDADHFHDMFRSPVMCMHDGVLKAIWDEYNKCETLTRNSCSVL